MNPFDWQAALGRWGAIAAIGSALFALGWLQGAHHEALKGAAFAGGVKALGDAQTERTKAINQQQLANLKDANHDLKTGQQAAADNAISNYIRRNPHWLCHDGAGGGALPILTAGEPGNDAASRQRLAAGQPDAAFIESCGRDAAKVGVWQGWAMKNGVPVE